MTTNKHSIVLFAYEYSILNNNYLISRLCKKQLSSAIQRDEEVELSMTFDELEDLIGYVAAESNHGRTRRQRDELGTICDYLETLTSTIERTKRSG